MVVKPAGEAQQQQQQQQQQTESKKPDFASLPPPAVAPGLLKLCESLSGEFANAEARFYQHLEAQLEVYLGVQPF